MVSSFRSVLTSSFLSNASSTWQSFRPSIHSKTYYTTAYYAIRIIGSSYHTTVSSASNPACTTRYASSFSNKKQEIKEKVCIIGSGNWGSAIAKIIGNNCQKLNHVDSNVNMWVFDEKVHIEGDDKEQLLSNIINTKHENVKYLPGIKLPKNIIAVPSLKQAIQNATLLVFVLPHQFLPSILPQIKEVIDETSENKTNCRGVSLIKGLDFDSRTKLPSSLSDKICTSIGNGFKCGVLMGANVAKEIGLGQFSESTLATRFGSPFDGLTHLIFHAPPNFRVQVISDVYGAETCAALKNVIALGAGKNESLKT